MQRPKFGSEDVVFVINPDGTVHFYLPYSAEDDSEKSEGCVLAQAVLAFLSDPPVLQVYVNSIIGRTPDGSLS